MNPFCAKHLKTNYKVTPYGDRGTERVKNTTFKAINLHNQLPD
jgi:hypothetical protein